MTPDRPGERRLYELFARYWDNTLTPDEAGELAERLAASPEARAGFELFVLHAVAAAELPAVEFPPRDSPVSGVRPGVVVPAPPDRTGPRGWNRRRALRYLAGGLAAGVGAVALGRWAWPDPGVRPGAPTPDRRPQLIAVRGTVTVHTPEGLAVPTTGPLPAKGVVSTTGFGSSVALAYADGSTVSLTGDSAVEVDGGGLLLRLRKGAAAADVRGRPAAAPALGLATAQVLLPAVNGAVVTLGRVGSETDVEVHHGQVNAEAPGGGQQLAVVRAGELLTVEDDGELRKRKVAATPDVFSLDLTGPLPRGWAVGHRAVTEDGPVLRLESWPDPHYNGTRMYQARSDHSWTRGLFRLAPDSRVRVRYRANASGRGQVCFCVRTERVDCPDTGMLEYNGGFEATEPGAWRWLDVRAGDMLAPPKYIPPFAAPWVGFLVIFNTFEPDLGLEVAEFRVAPPGAPR